MSMRRLTVFLSSTGKDLAAHRRAIIDHMRPLDGFHCDASEDFGARDPATIEFCRRRVHNADVLVGLIGHWRGWEPAGDNARRSITEMEYDWAADAGRSRLMFVAPEAAAAADAPGDMTPEAAARQQAFRARVLGDGIHDNRFYTGQFAAPADLAAAVMTALANVQYGRMLAAIQQQPPARSARAPGKPGFLARLFGRGATTEATPPADSPSAAPPAADGAAPANAEPQQALAAFTADPDLAPLLADPKAFDINRFVATVSARAQARTARGRAAMHEGATHLKAAAADYLRLADLVGYYDAEKSRDLLAQAIDADPSDGVTLARYADLCLATGKSDAALRTFERAAPHLDVESNPSGAFWGLTGLGDVYVELGSLDEARESYQRARAIAERLSQVDPGNDARKTQEIQRDLSVSHNKVGDVLVAQGQLPAALEAFRASLAIRERLSQADPGNAGWQRDVAVSHAKLAAALRGAGDIARASDHLRAGRTIIADLVARFPAWAQWKRDLEWFDR